MKHASLMCLAMASLLATGCSGSPRAQVPATPPNARPAAAKAAAPAPQSSPAKPAVAANRAASGAPTPKPAATADPAADLAAAAQRQAALLNQAIAASAVPADGGSVEPRSAEAVRPAGGAAAAKASAADPVINARPAEVIWIDTKAGARAPGVAATPRPAAAPVSAAVKPTSPAVSMPTPIPTPAGQPVAAAPKPASVATVRPVLAAAPASASATAAGKPVDRGALIARLMEEVRRGDDPALNKAMAAAALSLVDPSRSTLDPADLLTLTPPQLEQVHRFHDLVTSLRQQLASGKPLPDSKALATKLESIRGESPVRIQNLKLCRRVSGFGSYESFDTTSFLAGREQPVVVYVELEQFRSTKAADDQFHVRLNQEVTLYSEADGLAVWRQPAVEIRDQSYNRRRDFFVVQIVRLPARLSVGKYRLKVRVTDMADSSIDESSVPLQVVADRTLVSVGNVEEGSR